MQKNNRKNQRSFIPFSKWNKKKTILLERRRTVDDNTATEEEREDGGEDEDSVRLEIPGRIFSSFSLGVALLGQRGRGAAGVFLQIKKNQRSF